MSNTPDMNKEREAFEAWYCDQMRAAGYNTDEGIAQLREGNHYGKERVMLNGKWEGWQARASLAASAGSEPVASIYITPAGEREMDDWKVKLPPGRNLLYTHPSPPEGAGWKWVPTVPTNAMLHAAAATQGTDGVTPIWHAYQAMIAAAPPASEAKGAIQ